MKSKAIALTLLVPLLAIFAVANATTAHASAVASTASRACKEGSRLTAVTHRAGLVVTFGDRRTQTFCIEFSGDTISGLEQLQRSGLPLVTSGSGGLGAAVCSIGGQGSNDPTNCFASCTGGSCAYWAYYRYVDGAWKLSPTGASQTVVHDGDVLGWSWGPGGVAAGTAPETPGEICPNPTATPIATVTPGGPAPATPVAATPVPTSPPPPTPAAEPSAPPPTASPPQVGEPDEPTAPRDVHPQAPTAPTQSPESAVEGAAHSPATATGTPATATASPSASPKSGAIIIGELRGSENQARSESRAAGDGGSRRSLVSFGIVAAVLVIAAGGITHWRRRAV